MLASITSLQTHDAITVRMPKVEWAAHGRTILAETAMRRRFTPGVPVPLVVEMEAPAISQLQSHGAVASTLGILLMAPRLMDARQHAASTQTALASISRLTDGSTAGSGAITVRTPLAE